MTTITVGDGKYAFVREHGILTKVLRNGEDWPTCKELLEHVGAVHALLDEIERLSTAGDIRSHVICVCPDCAKPRKSIEPIADLRNDIKQLAQRHCDDNGLLLTGANIGWGDHSSLADIKYVVDGVSLRVSTKP